MEVWRELERGREGGKGIGRGRCKVMEGGMEGLRELGDRMEDGGIGPGKGDGSGGKLEGEKNKGHGENIKGI